MVLLLNELLMKLLTSKYSFFSSIRSMFTGTVLAQLFPFLILPIITRMLGVEEYGSWALFLSYFSILAVFATCRYEIAVLTSKFENDSIELTSLSLAICFFFCFLFLLPLTLIILFSLEFDSHNWLYFLPFCVFLWGVNSTLVNLHSRKQNFNIVASSKVIHALSFSCIQLILVWIFKTPLMMVVGFFCGTLISILFLYRYSDTVIKLINFRNYEKYIPVMRLYSFYPKYNLPSVMMDTLAVYVPLFLISFLYGPNVFGQFSLVFNTLFAFVGLASRSISQVFMSEISNEKTTRIEIYNLFKKLVYFLLFIVFFVSLPIWFHGPVIYSSIFGESWRESGEMAQILVFIFIVRFTISPVSTVLQALDKHKIAALWQGAYLASISAISFLAIVNNFELIDFLYTYIITEVILYIVYGYLIWKEMLIYSKS